MRTFCLLLFLVIAYSLHAQFSKENIIVTYCEVCESKGILSVDLDSDGDMDILAASSGNNRIVWYKNDGQGNFSNQIIISAQAEGLRSMYTADLDGDGDIDVLSASSTENRREWRKNDNKITWYKNDGQGGFSEEIIISAELTEWVVKSVYAADLDSDGDIDVLSTSSINISTSQFKNNNKIVWYENDGQDGFSKEVIISTHQGEYLHNVYAIDLDRDGDMDVLAASSTNDKIPWYENTDKIIWYRNDGQGDFSKEVIISIQQTASLRNVYIVDFDMDEDMDVLSVFSSDSKIAWYENDGNGNFSEEKNITTQADRVNRIYANDLDADGDLDILAILSTDNKIVWFENKGQGQFSEQIIISKALNPKDVYIDDLNSDGNMDVILTFNSGLRFDDRMVWYKNKGQGQFSEQIAISNEISGAKSAYAADLDNDGDMDVLSASYWDNKIAWYENNGKGEFSNQNIISIQEVNGVRGTESVYAIDIDGDEDVDVLSVSNSGFSFSYDDYKIAWYENDGKGHFSKRFISSIQAKSIYATDLDGDNDIDVLTAGDEEIAWYKNDGKGNFSDQIVISTQVDKAEGIYAIDLDGDNDMDVLSASVNDDKIAWYKNNGKGSFSNQIIISTEVNGAKSVYATDLDRDGDMDVLSAARFDNKIAWYKNNGRGNFSSEIIISTRANNAKSVYTSDLDDDGDMDVLSAGTEIIWYENDGKGSFSDQVIISARANSIIYSTDLDNDGDMDILSASEDDNKIAWHENLQDYPLFVKVFEDTNYNCVQEENEKGLIREVQTRALPSELEQILFTNEDGIIQKQFAAIGQDTAIEVRLLGTPNRFNSCPTTFLLKKHEQIDINLPVQLQQCPTLSVDIGTPFLRRCFDNAYSVSYCNNSKEDISDGYISIQMDSFLTIVQSDLTFEYKGNSLYDFILPTVGAGDCGDFQFIINLSCEAELGQTHCVEAHAYPDSVCTVKSLNNWSGASLRVAGTCEQDEVQFAVTNKGEGDMLEKQSLIIVEDMEIVKERELNLAKGITENVSLPANGATYHAYIQQVPNHPGRSAPIAHVEGCGGINTTGLVTAFRKDDGDTFKAIDCQENIGSYDPNDKTGFPIGLESEHYLEKNTRIKYKIRFQNTGTDTAFNIVILDTLPKNLDASTIEVGASSHAYEYDRFRDSIADLNILRFTFSNIMLPDSNINEPASHGFIQFSIDQQANLADGSIIENKAAIYFDFNEPIITNIAHHTIGRPLTRLTTSTASLPMEQTDISVYPNPFNDFISIEKKSSLKGVIFSLSDVSGRIVQSFPLVDDIHQIPTTQLEAGIYFYKVTGKDGQALANGKIVKQ